MYESLIKECLLTGQSKVYTVIVETYRKKIEELKPTLFRKWLAREIDVAEEKLNISSLHSALARIRTKEKRTTLLVRPADVQSTLPANELNKIPVRDLSSLQEDSHKKIDSKLKTYIESFVPTDPFAVRKPQEPQIKFVE